MSTIVSQQLIQFDHPPRREPKTDLNADWYGDILGLVDDVIDYHVAYSSRRKATIMFMPVVTPKLAHLAGAGHPGGAAAERDDAHLLWDWRPHLLWSITGHHSLWVDSWLQTINITTWNSRFVYVTSLAIKPNKFRAL